MLMSMEVYLRRGQRGLQRLMLTPVLREIGTVLAWWFSGFFLSAASLMHFAQPLAVGLICSGFGWRAFTMALGAMVGYPAFWGLAGSQGIVWSAAGGLLAILVGNREERRDAPLMMPVVMAFLVSVTGLIFRFFLEDTTPWLVFALRGVVTFLSAVLFIQAEYCRDALTDWLVCGAAVLALAQTGILGFLATGVLAVYGAFPAVVLGGLALDLAQVTAVPMTAVMAASFFVRMIPFHKRWQGYCAPAFCYLATMFFCGVRDLSPLPGLALGCAIGSLLPPKVPVHHRRGSTAVAQVRLEMGAEVMGAIQRTIVEMEPPPIDRQAILERAVERSCGSCSARRNCTQRDHLTQEHILNPLEADCRKPGRLIPELHRAQEQLRLCTAERSRLLEYRGALLQQYRFMGAYLRQLSDRLPRRSEEAEPEFTAEISVRSRGKERANGDVCMAFPGPGCQYYLLLCDGMGTGIGAAQEGQTAGRLLRQMLISGFPPEHALSTYNSLLALRGAAGAVTIDLARVRLDTGQATIYKWGAAASLLLTRKGVKKIGTASPPPGISVGGVRETEEKLSLCRGEVLVLHSDGLNGEDVLGQSLLPDMPPGELAAKILQLGMGQGEDDATVAVLRLKPTCPALS